jgi:hypothetical protein
MNQFGQELNEIQAEYTFKDSRPKMYSSFYGPGQIDTNPQKFTQTDKYLVHVWEYLQDYWELFGIFPKRKVFAAVFWMNQ